MAMLGTGLDALKIYYTGATVDGAEQIDPDLSLGRFRGDTEAIILAHITTGTGLANITVDYVSGANGPGVGVLTASGTGALVYTAPDGTTGDAVDIANGQTVIVPSGDDPGRYIRATRTSTANLAGSINVEMSDIIGNAIGMEPVLDAERIAGLVQYRCLALRNEHALAGTSIRAIEAWVDPVPGAVVQGPSTYATLLGATGAGTIVLSSGSFATWPENGWAMIEAGGGGAREVVYYTSRTATALTIPAAGRALCGYTPGTMLSTDRVVPWSGIAIAFEEPDAQPDGEFGGWDDEEEEAIPPTGLTFSANRSDLPSEFEILNDGEMLGLWIRWDVPAGAVATGNPPLHLIGYQIQTL
jgi:hypothetical protein